MFDIKREISKIHTNWRDVLTDLVEPYADSINEAINKDMKTYTERYIFPHSDNMFRCFNFFDIEDTRVMILGQDPYHTPGMADGLCFSVPEGCKMPPSLRNIFKELHRSYGVMRCCSDLSDWSNQGVLLLNTALSVVLNDPESHMHVWNGFIKDVIGYIGKMDIVVMLWGAKARQHKDMLHNCYVLEHTHPSPLSRTPFVGNNHFVECNKCLQDRGRKQ
eukprot:767875-Hanusia_phi.AAC.1